MIEPGDREDALARTKVTSFRSLMRITECSTLPDLESVINADLDVDCYLRRLDKRLDGGGGIEVQIGTRGTYLRYAFEIADLWSVVDDLEAEELAQISYEGLADEIALVEGFDVRVMIDYEFGWDCTWCDVSEWDNLEPVVGKAHRRVVSGGVEIQAVAPYPYQRAMKGMKTFNDWVAGRFRPNFPGLNVQPVSPDRGTTLLGTTLSELRSRTRDAWTFRFKHGSDAISPVE